MTYDDFTDLDAPRFRSGVAARLAKMPPSTLRIWERRYGVIDPPRSDAGQRLYSRRDVQRLITLKALSERGHAIGVIAKLDLDELERLARDSVIPSGARGLPQSVIAIGPGWQRPAAAGDDRFWHAYPGIMAAKTAPLQRPVDALLVRVAALHPDAARDVLKIAERCAAARSVVVYAFGTQPSIDLLRSAGIAALREVGRAQDTASVLDAAARARAPAGSDVANTQAARAPRRFSDAQLAAAARASNVVACECPRHLADLIAQVSAFEEYSDTCAARSANDALLHRYLGDVANAARQLFETALERLAEVEGLALRVENI